MANTSDTFTTTPWPTTVFYSTDSRAALSDVSSTWLSNATLYNDVLLNSNNDSPPRKIFIPCDNAENLVDKATREVVEGLLLMTVLPQQFRGQQRSFIPPTSLELFGVTTNVINCMVFVRQGLRDRINLCLFSLALADTSFLLFMFLAKFFPFLGLFDRELGGYWRQKHLSTVLGPMMGTMIISNLMTMIISVERCICVVSPFTAKRFLKTRYM